MTKVEKRLKEVFMPPKDKKWTATFPKDMAVKVEPKVEHVDEETPRKLLRIDWFPLEDNV